MWYRFAENCSFVKIFYRHRQVVLYVVLELPESIIYSTFKFWFCIIFGDLSYRHFGAFIREDNFFPTGLSKAQGVDFFLFVVVVGLHKKYARKPLLHISIPVFFFFFFSLLSLSPLPYFFLRRVHLKIQLSSAWKQIPTVRVKPISSWLCDWPPPVGDHSFDWKDYLWR